MKHFSELYRQLDATTTTSEKSNLIVRYLKQSTPEDACWAIYLFMGQRLKQVVPNKLLRTWAAQSAQIPDWLFDETYAWVGDLAETLSSILPRGGSSTEGSLHDWMDRIRQLRLQDEIAVREKLTALITQVADEDRFVVFKLFTGALRVGVSKGLVIRAVAEVGGLPTESLRIDSREIGSRVGEAYQRLIDLNASDSQLSQPYPFALANSWSQDESAWTMPDDEMLIEWKWDGIRAQLIRRASQVLLWSRGEERLDGKFPEVENAAYELGIDRVLDGELVGWNEDRALPFSELQRRIGRKTVGKKQLHEVPVRFIAFDLLERKGEDIRSWPQRDRRAELEELVVENVSDGGQGGIVTSTKLRARDMSELVQVKETARQRGAEGLMLKRLDSAYPNGRVRGHWWKWKLDPYSIDAVLIYAQRGHGRRAALYTDFTFALWEGDELVPFAKAYSGLTDQELREVDRFVRTNTQESFGPVRSVRPSVVMELAFENIRESKRHKCGLAVRFPRIVRWRRNKTPREANQLDDLKRMLRAT